jgi:hypothetical protein
MTRLANLTTLAATSAARPLLTSAQVQAFNGSLLPPCPRCNSIQLALSHRGDWFCPECSAWLAGVTVPCPDELPPVAALFWSIYGLAVSELEVSQGPLRYINAVIFPDGEVVYPPGREGQLADFDPFEVQEAEGPHVTTPPAAWQCPERERGAELSGALSLDTAGKRARPASPACRCSEHINEAGPGAFFESREASDENLRCNPTTQNYGDGK